MRRLGTFAIGVGAAALVVVAAAAAYAGFARLTYGPPPVSRGPASIGPSPTPGADQQTKQALLSWDASGVKAEQIKGDVMDAAVAYFSRQANVDESKLRPRMVTLGPAEYAARSKSPCEDAADVHPQTEAWLVDVPADTLFVNGGFNAPGTAVDLFFRYTIGLYTLAPELKSYPNGVKSSDGATAYYEKGLILLGRRPLDQLANTSCYLQYRRPLEEAFTADRAMASLAGLGLAPSPDYAYPQKKSLEAFRSKVAPRLGSTVKDLLEPFLKTDSGEFYRRAGRALGAGNDASEAAADRLFREVFPPT